MCRQWRRRNAGFRYLDPVRPDALAGTPRPIADTLVRAVGEAIETPQVIASRQLPG
jgi:hypothetical protein